MEQPHSLREWLIQPLSKEESDLVTRGKQYWAGYTTFNNIVNDPQQELDVLKQVCRGPMEDGLLDARGIIFLLFAGPPNSNPYAIDLKGYGTLYLPAELQAREFNAVDILQALGSKRLVHNKANELRKDVIMLAEKLATEAADVSPAIYRSLYVVILELQDTKPRVHAIWQCWSEVFQTLSQKGGFAENLAYISFLLVQIIFSPEELSQVKPGSAK